MAQKFTPAAPLQDIIRKRATDLYLHGGKLEGHDLENWQQAEAEILREIGGPLDRPAIVIHIEGVVYTAEYDSATAEGYAPGEWKSGERVVVRLEGDRMFLRRPNGMELETSIVKRIG